MEQKEIFQAVLIADNFNTNFDPYESSVLLPIVNVPLLDYALEMLNRSGVEEVILFCSSNIDGVKQHVKEGIALHRTWSIQMNIQIVSSEGCRCLGDALRDLDAKGLIRGHFVLLGADTVSNVKLLPIMEMHKANCKTDKGTAMTILYKKIPQGQRTGDEVMIATDRKTNRLLFHQKIKPHAKERRFTFPLEIFSTNSDFIFHHDLVDPGIAICSPAALPLFADNFDFLTRDDFVRGLLMNEEILASSIYVHELEEQQYARKVTNWQSYQMVSNDIMNRWVYPLVPNNGICCLQLNYAFLRNMVYKNKNAHLEREATLKQNVILNEKSFIDNETVLEFSVVGKNCRIGRKCHLNHAYVLDDTAIKDQVTLKYCFIGRNVTVGDGSVIDQGTVIGDGCKIPAKSQLSKALVYSMPPDDDRESKKLGDQAYLVLETPDPEDMLDEDEENIDDFVPKMTEIHYDYADSVYSSSSDDEDDDAPSPIQDDSNIFLSEVMESLKRGFEEKSNPDFLILEINSSRYAYNMSLSEVNFFVIKAVFSLSALVEANQTNVLAVFKQVMQYFSSVVKNYIKGADAMRDCLKALEEIFVQYPVLKAKSGNVLHYLYDQEVLSEDAIISWFENLEDDAECKTDAGLKKLIEWLQQSSEEESSDED